MSKVEDCIVTWHIPIGRKAAAWRQIGRAGVTQENSPHKQRLIGSKKKWGKAAPKEAPTTCVRRLLTTLCLRFAVAVHAYILAPLHRFYLNSC